MKLIAALAVSVPMLVAQTERPALHSVTAVRHWSLTGVTRVAIEVSGDFQFRSDRLHNPERIYFDILNARPRIDSRRFYSEDLDDKLVKRLRAAETAPGITRVVLELGGELEATTSQLANPNRLIIELRSAAPGTLSGTPGSATPPETPPSTRPPVKPASAKPAPPAVESPAPVKPPTRAAVAAKPGVKERVAPATEPLQTAGLNAEAPDTPPAGAPFVGPTAPPVGPVGIGKAAKHTSAGKNSLTRALGLKMERIVIDPGHGGHDQGTEGPKGLLEKDLVLDVATRLGRLIEDRMGAEVIYTRTDDTFVPLEGRTALANEKKADLFLSIHANSSPYPRIAGVETFYLNFTDSKEALDVASRENATSRNSIFDLQDIIQKITLHDKAEESKEFARSIQAALYAFSARNVPAEKNRGVKKAPFVVLVGASMPSVLAEIGFLSSSREEALLKKPDYRQKLAEALYRGVTRYAESLSHFQVAQK
jgi:N-acetylmuramoyl-L-alanine amidase